MSMKKWANYGVVVFVLAAFVVGCGGSQKTVKATKDRVVQTSGGKRPKWAIEKPRYIKSDTIFVSGQATIRGDESLSQGLQAAELKARARLAEEIGARISRQIQSASEGFDIDSQTLREITSLSVDRKLVTGTSIKERFYEKVAFTSELSPGIEQSRYDCYALAALSVEDLRKQVDLAWKEYETKLKGKDIEPKMRERFENRWSEFFKADE